MGSALPLEFFFRAALPLVNFASRRISARSASDDGMHSGRRKESPVLVKMSLKRADGADWLEADSWRVLLDYSAMEAKVE